MSYKSPLRMIQQYRRAREAALGVVSAAWTPASPTDDGGLLPIWWFRADAGTFQDSGFTTPAVSDGDVVGGWRDQSGNGWDVIQATTARKPTLQLSEFNTLPAVRFDGGDDRLRRQFVAGPDFSDVLTAFPVVRFNAFGGTDVIFSESQGGSNQNFMLEVNRTPNRLDTFFGNAQVAVSNTNLSTATDYLATITRSGSAGNWTVNFRVNNADHGTTAGIAQNPNGAGKWSVGSMAEPVILFLAGDIAELVVYGAALSVADRTQVETYLNVRFAIF